MIEGLFLILFMIVMAPVCFIEDIVIDIKEAVKKKHDNYL